MTLAVFSGCQWFQRPTESVKEENPQITPTPAPEPEGFPARAIIIHDGDTVTVLNDRKEQIKIRLTMIDAPEFMQRFGKESRRNLSTLLFRKDVRVIGDAHDKYGRLLAVIMLGEMDVNLEQIRKGFAWHYKRHMWDQDEEDRNKYAEAEEAAREQKLGLWADENPVPPWQFRKDEEFIKQGSDKPVKFN